MKQYYAPFIGEVYRRLRHLYITSNKYRISTYICPATNVNFYPYTILISMQENLNILKFKKGNNISKGEKYRYATTAQKNKLTQCQICGMLMGADRIWENV